jgi:glycosyltransferase involved in cell wall biosynthesis
MRGSFHSIVTLSDVSVGYGTPQVLSITRSLSSWLGASALILEPDQPERPPIPGAADGLQVDRLYTANHPYTLSGQAEYCIQAAERIDREKPDLVVLCSFLGAGAVLRMKHRPKLLIHYALEHTDGGRTRDRRLFNLIADRIDIAVFPEETRAQLDAPRLGLTGKPQAIVYNGSSVSVTPRAWNKRNGRFFYGGLLHPELTYGDYYLGGALDAYPIDLYGLLDGYPDPDEALAGLARRHSRVTYNGYAPGGASFLATLREYNYSIVMWAPVTESTRFAAPNKFFDAIQAGVPPIAAPHPLCQRLVQRYRCGLIVPGWTHDHLASALDEGRRIFFSGQYEDMVEGKLPAARHDLSWDQQFLKLARLIEATVKGQQRAAETRRGTARNKTGAGRGQGSSHARGA